MQMKIKKENNQDGYRLVTMVKLQKKKYFHIKFWKYNGSQLSVPCQEKILTDI